MSSANLQTMFSRFCELADNGSAVNQICDATNDGWGARFQAVTADPITHLGFRYGLRAATPPAYSIRLESLDAAGLPDNVDIGGASPTAAIFTPPATTAWDGTWQWIALTNAYTPTRGQNLVATIRASGVPDATNYSSFSYGFNAAAGANYALPHTLTLTAGTWTKQVQALPLFGYRTASGRYGFVFLNLYTTTNSTAGNRQAMKFSLPAGHGDTFQIVGLSLGMTFPAAAGSIIFGLWNAAGTALQAITVDTDFLGVNSGRRYCEVFFDEATLSTLAFGTDYYAGLEVVGTTAINLVGAILQQADDRLAWPGGTTRCLSVWDGSAWADTTTVLPSLQPIFADITEPAGGGGVVGGGGMHGGFS